jgi:hypothetical protein
LKHKKEGSVSTIAPFERQYPIAGSLLFAITDWWHKRHDPQDISILDTCGRAEFARTAHEMGLTTNELSLALSWSAGLRHFLGRRLAILLTRRMTALQIDRQELAMTDGVLLRKLQARCASCDHQARCEADLVRDQTDHVWEKYCPNARSLGVLKALQSSTRASQAAH